MMKKQVALLIVWLILFSLSINPITAQEPTAEAPNGDTVVVVPEETEVQAPVDNSGVTVVTVPTDDDPFAKIIAIIGMVITGLVAFASLASQYLTTKDLKTILGYTEGGETAAWNIARGATKITTALGGDPDVIISDKPEEIAAALRDGKKPILILTGVTAEAIQAALGNPPVG